MSFPVELRRQSESPFELCVLAMPRLLPFAAFAILFLYGHAYPATYCVGGPGGGTTHASIQAALNTAAANPGPDTIFVIRRDGITAQGILIENQDVTLSGAHVNCDPNEPLFEHTVLDASAGAALPALIVRNTSASPMQFEISGFDITGGDATNQRGGGIQVEGAIQMRVENVDIHDNNAFEGAGIAFIGTPDAQLNLGDSVQIRNNNAQSGGGGLSISGGTVTIDGENTAVTLNAASANGGGIALYGNDAQYPTRLKLRRGRSNDLALGVTREIVSDNFAGDSGGGIYAVGNVDVDAYTASLDFPVWIKDNFAQSGGGIAAEGSAASIRLWNVSLSGNWAAVRGGALYVADGAQLAIIDRNDPSWPLGALPCAFDGSLSCTIIGSQAIDPASGQPRPGALVALAGGASAQAATVRIDGAYVLANRGASLFADACIAANCNAINQIRLRGTLVAYNPDTPIFASLPYRSGLSLLSSTVTGTGQETDTAPLLQTSGSILVRRSIWWEPGRELIGVLTPDSVDADELLVSDASDLVGQLNILIGDPQFQAAGAGDFRLRADSPAVDVATNHPDLVVDANGAPRHVDLPAQPNGLGADDLGAFERQPGEGIFADGFDVP